MSTLPAQSNQPQAPASSWTPDRAVDLVVRRVKSTALVWVQSRPVKQRKLTFAETDLMKSRCAVVTRSLLPTNSEIDLKRIARALSAALMGYARSDTDKLVRDYTRLLASLPAWAVEQACDDIRQGTAVGMDPNFPPSAPAIHKVASEKMVEAIAERDRLTMLLTAPVDDTLEPPSPEAKRRVDIALQNFHDRMATPYDAALAAKQKAEREASDRKKAEAEEHSRRMQYILQGFEPPTNKHGYTMSLALARAIGTELVKRKPATAPRYDFSPSDGE